MLFTFPKAMPTLTLCSLVSPLQTFLTQIRPDKMSGLIWIQTVWHSDCIPERTFLKSLFWKNQQMTKKHAKFPRRQRLKYCGCYSKNKLRWESLEFWVIWIYYWNFWKLNVWKNETNSLYLLVYLLELQRFTEIVLNRDSFSDDTHIVSKGQFTIRLRYGT